MTLPKKREENIANRIYIILIYINLNGWITKAILNSKMLKVWTHLSKKVYKWELTIGKMQNKPQWDPTTNFIKTKAIIKTDKMGSEQ